MSHTLEQWRPIAGLEEFYEVSNLGRIRSKRYNRILKPQGRKYHHVDLGSHRRNQYVHFLVAQAFLPPCPGRHGVGKWNIDHINDDKLDNRAENLQWLPHWENCFIKAGGKARVKAQAQTQTRDRTGRFI